MPHNAVVHMLRKSSCSSSAVPGHLIVDAALSTLVLAQTFNVPVPACPNTENEETKEVLDMPEVHEHSTYLDEAGALYEG